VTMQANLSAIAGLQPAAVWRHFAELASVPRPSKREEQIRAHVRRFASERGFPMREDAGGNIVFDVPATPGHEHALPVVLQGHVDMVCEKNAHIEHDFDRDPIRLVQDRYGPAQEPIIRAAGTTLGADNGIGLALAMAAATTPEIVHPPLEILCTIDEEMGMTGAKALTPDFFRGRRMLNLDSEEDDALYIGCAGGCDTTITLDLKAAEPAGKFGVWRVTVAGLRGGHSGVDIHQNRANAIKLLVQTLSGVEDGRLRVAALHGGTKRNVIPREASALVIGAANLGAKLSAAGDQVHATAVRAGGEAGCTITVEKALASDVTLAATPKDTRRLLTLLTALPHGVLAVVPEIPGLVQTSNGATTVECHVHNGGLRFILGCLSRSSSSVQLHATARQLAAIGELAGAEVVSHNSYPGWQPNVNSPLLATCRGIYERLFGNPPKVAAIHAGLECGIIGERIGEGQMDMISLGPHIEGAHSPDERVYIASVDKSWRFLTAILAELAKG